MYLSTSVLSYLLIVRPGICVGVFVLVILSAIAASPSGLPFARVLVGGLAVALAAGAGSLVNDIYDLRADTLNNPRRVLPRGRFGIRRAWSYYLVLLIISLGLFWIASPSAFLTGVVVTVLLFVYSWKLRKISGVLSNAVIALSVASAFVFGILLTGQITLLVTLLFGFGFGITFAREILGDVIDLKGDEMQGLKTLPLTVGSKNALWIASVILFTTAMFSYTPLVITGAVENMVVGFGSSTFLVLTLILVLRKVREGSIRHATTILKGVLLVYPLLVVLGMKIL